MNFILKFVLLAFAAWVIKRYMLYDSIEYYELLSNKNVIITGGSSGIGEQAAYYCAKMGASVVILARREQLLKKVVENMQKLSQNKNAKFGYLIADFSKVSTGKEEIEKSLKLLGGSLDYLILNHALLLTNTNETTYWTGTEGQYELLDISIQTNFKSYIRLTDYALPYLEKSKGRLLAVSSMIVEQSAFAIPYAISKSALNAFFSGLRQEKIIKKVDMSITILNLGFVETDKSIQSLESLTKSSGEDYKKLMSIYSPTSPEQAGISMVQAAARREAYFYYPYNQSLWILRALTPCFHDPDHFKEILKGWILNFVDLKAKFGF